MEIREFSRNDRVKVNNVYGWDISFYSDVARRDITIQLLLPVTAF